MKSMYVKIALFVLIVGLLTACSAPPATETVFVQPTEEVATAQATETAAATEAPVTEAPVTEVPAVTEPAAATQPAVEGATISFANDVMPIIQSRCINCHGGDRTEEGLVLGTHADLLAGSDNGPVITPGDATNSLLVELVAAHKMPKRGPKLTPPQVQLITDWVNQGALNN